MPPQPTTAEGRALTFKEQLDQAAINARCEQQKQQQEPSVVEKVTNKILSTVQGSSDTQEQNTKESAAAAAVEEEKKQQAPPHRPDHDVPIEEFVRDQHRSDGGLSMGK